MDQILITEIDEILKTKLPYKSAVSGANWIMVPPDNTQSLPINSSNVYRIRLPKFGGGYLARSKGQTGPFLVFTISAGENFIAEPYALIKQIRILCNGVEVHNNLYFNHTYAQWLKMKNAQWLNSDAGQFYFPGVTQTAANGTFAAMPTSGATSFQFILPFPDNYSVLNNKNHALPLENVDWYIELYLNNANNMMGQAADGTASTNPTVSNLLMYIPVVYVDPDVDRAIQAKLEAGDNNDEEMMLLPIEDIKVDSQSSDFTSPGTKTFVFHSVSSSARLLEAILSPDLGTGSTKAYKTFSVVNPGIYQYQYVVDGRNVSQNPITCPSWNHTGQYDLAYTMYQDFVSAYNQINNDVPDQSFVSKKLFDSAQTALNPAIYVNPAYNAALSDTTGGCFSMVANLDTVSKEELIGGVKLIGNLQLNVYYDGINSTTVAPAAGVGQANCYLIQHTNRIVALSKSKCKVLK